MFRLRLRLGQGLRSVRVIHSRDGFTSRASKDAGSVLVFGCPGYNTSVQTSSSLHSSPFLISTLLCPGFFTVIGRWEEVDTNGKCDESAGEKYMKSSPGKVPTVQECQRKCTANLQCKSITYFKSTFCSFFSTPCSATKRVGKALALRLLRVSTAVATTSTMSTQAPTTTAATTTQPVIKKCRNWCRKHGEVWAQKCRWPLCNGCSECGMLEPRFASTA